MDDAAELPEEYAMALGFDSDTHDFVRGFQLGMLWGRITPARVVLVYSDTAEMLARMLDDHPGAFAVHDNGDDWLAVEFPEEVTTDG